MTRVKKGLTKKQRHKKILSSTKGYRGAKSKLVRVAKEASLHAGEYAFAGRKQRKRSSRRLWITQINAALRESDITYREFIKKLKDSKVELDRKILADIAKSQPKTFNEIIKKA